MPAPADTTPLVDKLTDWTLPFLAQVPVPQKPALVEQVRDFWHNYTLPRFQPTKPLAYHEQMMRKVIGTPLKYLYRLAETDRQWAYTHGAVAAVALLSVRGYRVWHEMGLARGWDWKEWDHDSRSKVLGRVAQDFRPHMSTLWIHLPLEHTASLPPGSECSWHPVWHSVLAASIHATRFGNVAKNLAFEMALYHQGSNYTESPHLYTQAAYEQCAPFWAGVLAARKDTQEQVQQALAPFFLICLAHHVEDGLQRLTRRSGQMLEATLRALNAPQEQAREQFLARVMTCAHDVLDPSYLNPPWPFRFEQAARAVQALQMAPRLGQGLWQTSLQAGTTPAPVSKSPGKRPRR